MVNWNGREQTLECLAAVHAQLAEVSGAVVSVVDNGSTDGSAVAIASRYPQVRLFALDENRGFTGGIRAALRASNARNIVYLNNDAFPEAGWLASLVRAIDDAPADVISVAGKIVDLEGQRVDFVGGVMTFDGHAFQSGFRFPLGSVPEPQRGGELLFACGGNMVSRRAPLLDLGGFDDDYFAYLEDVDFGWRSWLSGFRVIYEPDGLVRHASSATSNRIGAFERGVLFERNALQTALKNYDDESLRGTAGAVFFTYLHRLHHFATTRNERIGELRRSPFEGAMPGARRRGIAGRIRNRIFGPPALGKIDDPLTAMQFRALEWILQKQERIIMKRKEVQAKRRRPDAEIFAKFPLQVVPTYPGDDSPMRGALFRLLRPQLPAIDRKQSDIIKT
ncbi:MAG TPA: glycosyltransferase family 2 protein [Thermoanaerobaculia bacterium]|nr:glycosyltransferase family 2 protein [Thermoanaerobaculia bacterium]